MRILPYRTLDNVIEGAVITFVDITDMKRARETVAENQQRFQAVIDTIPEATFAIDSFYRLVLANRAFEEAAMWAQAPIKSGELAFPRDCAAEVTSLWRSCYERAFRGETFTVDTAVALPGETCHFKNTFTPVLSSMNVVTMVVVSSWKVGYREEPPPPVHSRDGQCENRSEPASGD
jgi:hypothetical protein